MINSGKVVEPTGITVVAEVAQREKDLVRWPAKDKATADNHWRHARQCCVQLCWWRYFRQESPEDRQPVIHQRLSVRSKQQFYEIFKSQRRTKSPEPSRPKTRILRGYKKIWSLQFDFGFITTDDSFEQQVQAIAICLQQSTTPAVR